jgi:hypothetical protein
VARGKKPIAIDMMAMAHFTNVDDSNILRRQRRRLARAFHG